MLFFFGLTLYTACGDRSCLKALLGDILAANLTAPVLTPVDPAKRFLKLHNKFTLPVLNAQEKITVGLKTRAIRRIWKIIVLGPAHTAYGLSRLVEKLLKISIQEALKIIQLFLIHVIIITKKQGACKV